MPTALVFGASGQIGAALLPRLQARGWQVQALSREARAPTDGVSWLRGGFQQLPALPTQVDAVFSCGPLDHFGQWITSTPLRFGQVVAFGSTSVLVKHDSVDMAERDLAARLQQGEAAVFAAAAEHGIPATVLRPTLVYGAGRDATLTRIAALARRLRGFPLPADARGLRQPVHVDDLADAAIACLGNSAAHGRALDLPGGETLPYDEMVRRVLAVLPSRPPLWRLPTLLFAALAAGARLAGRADGFGPGARARLREDLVFDSSPARETLGYAPRAFAPTLAMLTPQAGS